ncbi:MAG: hypothetical protein ACMG6S_21230, partial [Byssovorax sp.]
PKGKSRPALTLKDATAKKPAALALNEAVKFTTANEVDAASIPALRALAAQLLAHPEWSLAIGARPSPRGGDAEATARAQAVVKAIRGFARRDKAASVAPWSVVQAAPRAAELGLGILLIVPDTRPADAK